MNDQMTFADIERSAAKVTKREQFLADMEAVVPWEHAFQIIKVVFGFRKTRYKGEKKTRHLCTFCTPR